MLLKDRLFLDTMLEYFLFEISEGCFSYFNKVKIFSKHNVLIPQYFPTRSMLQLIENLPDMVVFL